MSTLTAHLIGEGIVFAADRNITVTTYTSQTYQIEGEKIFRWPNNDALVGYVGRASVHGIPMEDWLTAFIRRHPNVSTPSVVAKALQSEIQAATAGLPLTGHIIQFAAFADVGGVRVPQYYHIANVYGMDDKLTGHYDSATATYGCSEELLGNWAAGIAPSNLRGRLQERADDYNPQWFHHSIDLAVYNTLEAAAKAALDSLHKSNLLIPPQTLADWEKHAKFWILQYGAYYTAFYPAHQQYVGGADALSIPWP